MVLSAHRTEGPAAGDDVRLRYDVGLTKPAPFGAAMTLRMSYQFQERPGEAGTTLRRSRFFGDLRKDALRLHGQFVPWQRAGTGDSPPRQHDIQLGLDLAPRRAPHLTLNWSELERDLGLGRSRSEDRRARASYALGPLAAELGFRRLDATPAPNHSVPSRTEEWRGGLTGSGRLGPVSGQASYDALLSDFASRERRREQATHGVNMTGAWNPHARVAVTGSFLGRWGKNEDNARPEVEDVDERYLSAGARYRPAAPLEFALLRESRRHRAETGVVRADYYEVDGTFRKTLLGRLSFQSGARQSVILESEEDVPQSSAYAFVDGNLRPGVDGRAEARASRSRGTSATGTQWRRLLQLRTRPSSATRLDVTWTRDTLPIAILPAAGAPADTAGTPADSGAAPADTVRGLPGLEQNDRQWEIVAGYDPLPGTTIVGSFRFLDGTGRVERKERLTSLSTTWRFSRRASVSWNWSWRRSRADYVEIGTSPIDGSETRTLVQAEATEMVRGVDVTAWLPGEFRAQASWRGQSVGGQDPTATYGLTLNRNF